MTDTPPTLKKRRWVMPLLLASLAVNLLIVGLIVGWAFSDGRTERAKGPIRGVLGEPFVRALPESARQSMRRDIMQERGRFKESRDALRDRFQAFLTALRSDPFAPDEVIRLLKEQRQVGITRQEFGEELLLRRLSEMSAEERGAYADRLERQLKSLRPR